MYEEDIVEIVEDTISGTEVIHGVITYEESAMSYYIEVVEYGSLVPLVKFMNSGIKVIGNTHQTPNLSKV